MGFHCSYGLQVLNNSQSQQSKKNTQVWILHWSAVVGIFCTAVMWEWVKRKGKEKYIGKKERERETKDRKGKKTIKCNNF